MDCKVCKQDIASFIKVDEILESDIPYLKCKCPYCSSVYKIVDSKAENVILVDKDSKTYEQDLSLAKKVKLSKIRECSILEITDEVLQDFHPKVIDSSDFLVPLYLNDNYCEKRELMENASVDNILFVEEG